MYLWKIGSIRDQKYISLSCIGYLYRYLMFEAIRIFFYS